MNLSVLKQIVLARRKPLLCLVVIVAIAFSVRMFISAYQEPQLESSRAEWSNVRAEESRGAANASKEAVFANGKNDLAKLREKIYSKNQFARFISEIYDAAGKNNLEITSITYKHDLDKDEQLFKYSMTLSTSGKYIQQKKFIRDIHSSANLLHIDAITLASQGGDSGMVQLQTQLTTYFKVGAQ